MIIRETRKICCRFCREELILRSYEGLDPEAFYSDHTCEQEVRAVEALAS